MRALLLICLLSLLCGQCHDPNTSRVSNDTWPRYQGLSVLGDSLYAQEPAIAVIEKLNEAKDAYANDPDNAENIIWYGRRMGYTGDYKKAIDIFKEGMTKHPDDARFPRHRGHRYLSIRAYDAAIADYEKAVRLIANKPNKIEPDGIPNARNTPVSTLHGNIWYHKGLAHYLKNEMDMALTCFTNCRASGSLPDNLVSSTHWIYMILRRLGRVEEARKSLDGISADMDIIENTAYHKLCLFYKDEILLSQLSGEGDPNYLPGQDAIAYGIANWHLYSGNEDRALSLYKSIVERPSWNSFGYIAAEADYNRLINN